MKQITFKRWRGVTNQHYITVEVPDDFDPSTITDPDLEQDLPTEPWDLTIVNEWEDELDCQDAGEWELDAS